MSEGQWFLVQCKPRESFRAEMHLENQGYPCFHPTHRIKRKRAGTIKTEISPLFPFYLFVFIPIGQSWSSIRSTRGVKNMVTFNGVPAKVGESIIQGLKHHCDMLNGLTPAPLFKKGDKVRITEGCFQQLEAVVTATKGEDRVILLLNLFHQEQNLEFPVTALEATA